jgi:DNA-binding Xre family transcriptional regulator
VRLHLKARLEERGLTQAAVSAGSGVNYVTINRMANDNMQHIDHSVLDRLCRYLELVSLEELLETGGLMVWEENGHS